jgi:radical SAM superfamily enzyme
MAVILQFIFIIAAVVTIVGIFKDDKKKPTDIKLGLYETTIQLGNKEYQIRSEVQMIRDYGDNDIHVSHNKIFGLPSDKLDKAMEILLTEHTLISKEDVKWKI